MKNICISGFLISQADQKVLNNYLLGTPKEWAQKALEGMINKAKKIILRDWFEIYRQNNPGNISSDYSVLIPEIVEMEEFKSYDMPSTENEIPERKEIANIEIWENGFTIEDWELTALQAYYKDPEQTLYDLMNNKIAKRKKAFYKQHSERMLIDVSYSTIPSHYDDMINLVVIESDYKTRAQKDAEIQAQQI